MNDASEVLRTLYEALEECGLHDLVTSNFGLEVSLRSLLRLTVALRLLLSAEGECHDIRLILRMYRHSFQRCHIRVESVPVVAT